MRKQKKLQPVVSKTKEEKIYIKEFCKRRNYSPPPKFEKTASDSSQITVEQTLLNQFKFMDALGTTDLGWAGIVSSQLMSNLPNLVFSDKIDQYNSALAALYHLRPQDEIEAMLIAQMMSTHFVSMECLRRAGLPDQAPDGLDANVNRSTKLMRTFTAQMEALHRYRSKGEQKMTVEHVHVHEGGQAIVGKVNLSKPRGGENGNDG